MTERAPLPPWWVAIHDLQDGSHYFDVMGGSAQKPFLICTFWDVDFENARELADLIVQRTKQ